MKATTVTLILMLLISSLYTGGKNLLLKNDTLKPPGKRYRPIVLNDTYQHTRWGIEPADIVYHFAAFTTSFDSEDDNNGDGVSDLWGVPEWVAFEIKKNTKPLPSYKRPSKWLTDDSLHALDRIPNDETYGVCGTNELKVVKTNSRFIRGHLCPKNTADRLGENAGYNTHTVLNAIPQLQWQNNGIWKHLEEDCTAWADKYGSVWVITGPAFFRQNPGMWLGQFGEVPAAIPDALYKIIIRENEASSTGIETISFLFPNIISSNKKVPSEYIISIAELEKITQLKFLTELDETKKKTELSRNENLSEKERKTVYLKW